jgi:hypothetical protein
VTPQHLRPLNPAYALALDTRAKIHDRPVNAIAQPMNLGL